MKDARDKSALQLGELEAEIMRVVWSQGEATVQETQRALAPKRSLAYTTVMTVMSRLAEKGFLERRKDGRAYVYRPVAEQSKLAGSMLRSLVGRLYGGSSAPAIAQLIETDDRVDEKELGRLEELIRAKRRQLEGGRD